MRKEDPTRIDTSDEPKPPRDYDLPDYIEVQDDDMPAWVIFVVVLAGILGAIWLFN